MDKLTEAVTVKLTPSQKEYASIRAGQLSLESPGEYFRQLLEADHARAFSDLTLLAKALNVKVIKEN